MTSVEIRDVRRWYGALEVLHGVDIEIAYGEFVVLVGYSGCERRGAEFQEAAIPCVLSCGTRSG